MDKFLERNIIPKLTDKEIENLNESFVTENVELVILKLPTKSNKKETKQKKKTQSQMSSLANSTKKI